MKHSLQNNLFFKQIITTLFILIVLGLISYIPIRHSTDVLKIGGDAILPIIPEFAFRNAYDWIDYTNGTYVSSDYAIWISMFYILNKLTNSIYHSAFLFQFLIFLFSGLGIFKLFNLFNSKSRLWGLLPAVAFIYSPHIYDHMAFFYATSSTIWLLYFLMKFVKTKEMGYPDVIAISLLTGLMGNLPNPKYHFLIFLIYVLVISLSVYLRTININDLRRNIKYLILILLSTTYISLPFVYYGINFSKDTSLNVAVQNNTGQSLDYGSALISKMITMWHTPSLNPLYIDQMSSGVFLASYYLFPLLVIGLFPFILVFIEKGRRQYYLIYYALTLFFVFLSKGPNPPFGYAYSWIVDNIKVFAFLRTTAGMVIYIGIFYSILFGVIIQFLSYKFKDSRNTIVFLSVLLVLISGFHIWSGAYFKNYTAINQQADKEAYGLRIPDDYFKSAYFLDNLHRDTKVRISPGVSGYQNNSWGYFGPIIYPWYISNPTVSIDLEQANSTYDKLTNTGYVYHDKTLISDEGVVTPLDRNLVKNSLLVYKSKDVDIYRRDPQDTKPRFYLENNQTAAIEYKKVNPTKYKLRIHNAKGMMSLIFTDNYNKKWNAHHAKYSQSLNLNSTIKLYKIFPFNELDQATLDELQLYVNEGIITSLGKDSTPNTTPIAFVSKKFNNTIQNDNLPNGNLFETLTYNKLNKEAHFKANDYLNGWKLDIDALCNRSRNCIRNKNNTYDLELIIEFSPQLLTYFGYSISITTLSLLYLLIIRNRIKRLKSHD